MLIVNEEKTASDVRISHEARFLTNSITCPLRLVQMRFFTRDANREDLSELSFVDGVLPKTVAIGLAETLMHSMVIIKKSFV